MPKLAIISRDADNYLELLENSLPRGMQIMLASNTLPDKAALTEIDILLAEPDLACQCLPHCAQLKWLQSTWAGVTPLIKQPRRDYVLTGIKELFGQQMCEYVFAWLLNFTRDLDSIKAQQREHRWGIPAPASLAGKTISILGVGSIGKAVARMSKAFGMTVQGLTRNSRDCGDVDTYFSFDQRLALASTSDFVINLLPHTAETEKLVDREMLAHLPKHAILINAGRGQTIDDEALLHTLNNNALRAAVLDVFEREPLPSAHPFWTCKNLLVTHHSAAISHPHDISRIFLQNCQRYLAQRDLMYVVDFNKGY